ncbi:MAG: tRNA lysidine(34) synthetase TilS [Spirochaetia bacterium]|jgi:tRNA(Ile)-lysidine synthase|nr:tRNA lysidine(34) synthetase TilS [Spirochaetia bacterium]
MKSIHVELRRFFCRLPSARGERILVAVSGGPDSTALALGLADLRGELGIGLALAHYDHGLRSAREAREERDFVLSLGEGLGLPVETGGAGGGVLRETAAREKKSLEALARERRYAFLHGAAGRLSCGLIALGHTRGDRIETQIFRFFQGSSPKSLGGIPAKRGRVLRPLINLGKGDILAFLEERGQGFCTDASNQDTVFLRNHLRRALLPAVEKVFPGYAKALDALAEKSRLYGDFVESVLAEKNPWKPSGGGWECPFEEFLGLHPLLRIESVYGLFAGGFMPGGEKRIPYSFLRPLAGLGREKAGGTVLRGRGLVFRLRKGRMIVEKDIVLNRKKGYFYHINGNLDFCIAGRLRVQAEEAAFSADSEGGDDVFPLVGGDGLFLRSRRPGDAIALPGGRKTLNRLFASWKLEEDTRDMVPLVQKNGKILAVLAAPFGGKTLRLPDTESGNKEKSFRIRIHKIGEEREQTK